MRKHVHWWNINDNSKKKNAKGPTGKGKNTPPRNGCRRWAGKLSGKKPSTSTDRISTSTKKKIS